METSLVNQFRLSRRHLTKPTLAAWLPKKCQVIPVTAGSPMRYEEERTLTDCAAYLSTINSAW